MADDKLWGVLSSDNNRNDKSAETLMQQDASDSGRKSDLPTDAKSKRAGLLLGAGGLILALLGVFLFNPFFGPNLLDEPEEKEKQATTAPEDNSYTPPATPWYDEEENILPTDEPAWATNFGELDAGAISDDQKTWVEETVGNTKLSAVSAVELPSEELGYTSNTDEALDENGAPNPDYSFWTDDLFKQHSTLIAEKLLNPSFGGWASYQYANANASKNFDVSIFSDIFTPAYSQKLKNNKSATPVYADWQGNNYGLASTIISSGGPRWTGEITGAVISFEFDQATQNTKAIATYQVKFTTWTKDQQKLTRTGELKLDFVANPLAVESPERLRLLVADGSLTVNN